ncbi:MAG: flagellar M-ring protein FliF, partial [Microbacteriaceae bacterium]|nr:flagellar M-ring protein FliF [Microbacteriaceae bacterium]
TILVPEGNVYAERLKAAAAGLPTSSNGGYALLDKMGVTSSEFQQDVTYKRALEGELASTIEAMQGVKVASVKLAIPKDTVFVSEKADPTASVFIETQSGVTLNDDQVQAIVHLTSASVDGMKAADVSVIDSKGIVLSAAGTDGTGGGSKAASDYETRVQSSVQAMLDKVVGPGNSTVVVAADLNLESGSKTSETYTTPDNAPAINESTTTERDGSGSTDGTSAGVLGPDNIAVPSGTSTDAPASSGSTTTDNGITSQQVTKNNAINKVTEQTTIPAGELTKQTVSVAINSAAAKNVNVKDITSLVNAAAGIDKTRGDSVSVQMVSFNAAGAVAAASQLAEQQKAEAADRTADLIKTGLIILGISLPAIIIAIMILRRARKRAQELQEARDLGELDELRAMMTDQTVPMELTPPVAPNALTYTQLPPIEPGDADRKRAEIDALAGADPARTAEILRGFMDDRQPV